MKTLYTLFGIIIIAGYAYIDLRGLELTPQHRQFVPQGLRAAAHGGYRSYWSSGYHGGK
jgi:hypothetical protein